MGGRSLALFCLLLLLAGAERPPREADFYELVTVPVPEGLKLEVSGIARLPEGRVAVAIRRGEVWLVDGLDAPPPLAPRFHRYAAGLHEPLGLAYHEGALFVVQRGELTRLEDRDGDGTADGYWTVASGWGLTGNYHEYAYGPEFDAAGNAWITLNATLGRAGPADGSWRGWVIRVRPDGSWSPIAGGLRSPCGLGQNLAGDIFFTDQQGNWIPTCSLQAIETGRFYGYVDALADATRAASPLAPPADIPAGLPVPEAARRLPALKLPAVWFPYRKMGQASTDILCDTTGGRFGPFAGQLFVGDFTLSRISRVFLEKVDGAYQGACFPFRRGLRCAALRLGWSADGALLVGETNRGWNSLGDRSFGLERLRWTGRVPFELHSMRARAEGFELSFTRELEPASATRPSSYSLEAYTYRYHSTYGSDEIDTVAEPVVSATLSDDRRRVTLVVARLRPGYVHELHLPGVRSRDGEPLLHAEAYYTLNRIPAAAPRR